MRSPTEEFRDQEEDATTAPDAALLCASCRHPITHDSERTEVDGAHESVRVNLAGMVFRVGCFSRAPGCRPVGEITANWTWFAGHTWQVVVCGRCGDHLGWLYRGASRFYGLLLDHLTAG
jgi:hypothetical protein